VLSVPKRGESSTDDGTPEHDGSAEDFSLSFSTA
jgi:hypothetical protein